MPLTARCPDCWLQLRSYHQDLIPVSKASKDHFWCFQSEFPHSYSCTNLVSLQLDVYKGRVPVLETMPPLLVAVVTIHDSCADRCICDDCGDYCVEICQGFLQNDGSCVLLQGLSQAEDLGLVSGVETVCIHFRS